MNRRNNPRRGRPEPRRTSSRLETPAAPKPERKAPVVYGPPYIVLEDEAKKTFVYDGGAWIPDSMSMAQYRQTCQVKELPQKVNRMIRYEVRSPVST